MTSSSPSSPLPSTAHHDVNVLLVGAVSVSLKTEVIDSLDFLGDRSLQEDIKRDAVGMGVEDTLGGQSVENVKKSRMESDSYYCETNLEGLVHRFKSVMRFMDRAEGNAESAITHLSSILDIHSAMATALSSGDVETAQKLLASVSPSTEALHKDIAGIIISEEDLASVESSAPSPGNGAKLPLLQGFIPVVGSSGGGGGVVRRAPIEKDVQKEEEEEEGEEGESKKEGEEAEDDESEEGCSPAEMGYAMIPDDDGEDEEEEGEDRSDGGGGGGDGPDANSTAEEQPEPKIGVEV